MAETILDRLRAQKLLQKIVLPDHVALLLGAAEIQPPRNEKVKFAYNGGTGSFNLNLNLPDKARDFALTYTGPAAAPNGFIAAISLKEGPQEKIFNLAPDAVGRALVPARVRSADDEEWLEPLGGGATSRLKGGNLWLVVIGEAGGTAHLKLAPNPQGTDVLQFDLDPPAALFGGSGFGMAFPAGLALDMAEDAVAPGRTRAGIPERAVTTPADTAAWQGLVVRDARFFLPKGVPFIGGHASDASLQVGLPPNAGIALVLDTRIAGTPSRPPIDVHLECIDPTVTGLSSVLPTLVQASMELPVDAPHDVGGTTFTFLAGKPVRARARYARQPGTDQYEFSLALESQGERGIASVDGNDTASRAVTATAMLATAILANDPTKKDLGQLLLAGLGFGSTFLKHGSFVVHSAEVAAAGRALPTDTMRFRLDYSVATVIQTVGVGPMSLQMNDAQPLRIRVRDVELSIDRGKSGLAMFDLDYSRSAMEIEDPGGWTTSNASLFDVLGTRPVKGSVGFEVDLGFRLDLGPVKVTGATVRVPLPDLKATLTGLAASLDLKPLIGGSGSLQLLGPGSFKATLGVEILPLKVKAYGLIETNAPMVRVEIDAEFPGPLPLANSGLAIYGVGGAFVANGKPDIPEPRGPSQLLSWAYAPKFERSPGQHTFGLKALIGTAPDLGFSFSAIAGLTISTPTVNVIGTLDAGFLGPRKSFHGGGGGAVNALGVLAIDSSGIGVAVQANMQLPVAGPTLLDIQVPIAARFPFAPSMSDWYLHLGADGYPKQGRELGPIRATLLPMLFPQKVDAYFMVRGGGLEKFPRGQGPDYSGALTAFGFSFDFNIGLEPIVWADVYGRGDFLLTMDPVAFLGQAQLGGSLNIGVFSVGVDATLDVAFIEDKPPFLKARVCGTVDLFFDEIHECVELSMNTTPTLDIVEPPCPLDHEQGHWLIDDRYGTLRIDPSKTAKLAAERSKAATVWPDAIPLLTFATTPKIDPAIPVQPFKDLGTLAGSKRLGNDLLWYEWTLKSVRLFDVTDAAAPDEVLDPLSCAWQVSKFGGTSGDGGAVELALLTPDAGIWVNAVADADGEAPKEPIRLLTDLCRFDPPTARPGWAIGDLAQSDADRWRLPSDPVSGDPLQSQVRATVWTWITQADAPLTRWTELPTPDLIYRDAHGMAVDAGTLNGRAFTAALAPPQLDMAPNSEARRELWLWLSASFDDELADAEVYLFVEQSMSTQAWETALPRAGRDENNEYWTLELVVDVPATGWIVRARSKRARQFDLLVLPGTHFSVLGVYGTSKAARDEAARRQAQLAQQIADKQGNVPNDGSQTTSSTDRCVLEPGKVYRIDVALEWTAIRKQKVSDPDTPVGPATAVSRQYFFRTASLRKRPVSQIPSVAQQHVAKYTQQKVFNPQMLERHLQGYTPGQGTLDWFRDDAVGAHFAVGHVAALAGVYGFTLGCTLRRIDSDEPAFLAPPAFVFPSSGAFFQGTTRHLVEAYLQSPCGFPPPGLVIQGQASLAPLCWYEVYVTATPTATPSTKKPPRLPGASFRTSRWSKPSDMLDALGFSTAGAPGAARGDVELVRAVKNATTRLGRDTEFEALLRAYAIEGWAAPHEPRISHLWVAEADAWHWAGVYLESPEPIHRAGRFVTDDASGSALAVEGATVTIDVRGSDRSGCRLLYGTTTPFLPPAAGAVARLACTDLATNAPLVGRLAIPARPSFA